MEATAIDPRTPCGRRTMPPTMGKRGVTADRRRHRASTPTVQRGCRRSVRHDLGSGHRQRPERMFAPIAAGFVLVDTGGWLWIRTAGAPRDGGPGDGELH